MTIRDTNLNIKKKKKEIIFELWVFSIGTDYEWIQHDIEFKKKKDIEDFIKNHIPNYIHYKIIKSTRDTIKEYIPAAPDYYIG